MTPSSSLTAYATAADLLLRYDWRVVADLCLDENERPSRDVVAFNPRLLTALRDASGAVEAACLKGGRYEAADLGLLSGVSENLLVLLVCQLALGRLYGARDPGGELSSEVAEGKAMLESLATGERIFAFAETQEAGVLGTVERAETDMQDEFRLVRQAERFFGRRRRLGRP